METQKLIPIKNEKMWCYIAPDGAIQTRSIQPTLSMCNTAIAAREYDKDGYKVTHKDYKKAGYKLKRISVIIKSL